MPQVPGIMPTRLITGDLFDETAFNTPMDALKQAKVLSTQGQMTGDDYAQVHKRLTVVADPAGPLDCVRRRERSTPDASGVINTGRFNGRAP